MYGELTDFHDIDDFVSSQFLTVFTNLSDHLFRNWSKLFDKKIKLNKVEYNKGFRRQTIWAVILNIFIKTTKHIRIFTITKSRLSP